MGDRLPVQAPDGLQLDLLTLVVRLEQLQAEMTADGELSGLGTWLLQDRVLRCDLPRLRRHLEPATLAFQHEADAEQLGSRDE